MRKKKKGKKKLPREKPFLLSLLHLVVPLCTCFLLSRRLAWFKITVLSFFLLPFSSSHPTPPVHVALDTLPLSLDPPSYILCNLLYPASEASYTTTHSFAPPFSLAPRERASARLASCSSTLDLD
jgi:hypothetical protein